MIITYKPKAVGKLKNPIMIVGQCPGKVRNGTMTQHVWVGNRSADLMQEIIAGYTNLYLTNTHNNYVTGSVNCQTIKINGRIKLMQDIVRLQPKAIFCFGTVAYETVLGLRSYPEMIKSVVNVVYFHHPSSVLRFRRNSRELYKLSVRKAIEVMK